MIRIDSLHIEIPIEGIQSFNRQSFIHQQEHSDSQTCIVDRYKLRPDIKAVGFSGAVIDNINQTAKLNISAKVLKDDYFQGINLNSIERVVDSINQLGIIHVCPDMFVNEGRVMNVDETHNVNMGYALAENWNQVSSELAISVLNPKFQPNIHNTKRNQGITFKGSQTSQKNRLIMYNKYIELMKSGNKLFMASLKNPMLLLDAAKNNLRCEVNMTDFKFIRERFKSESLLLGNLLTAPGKPVIDMIDKITKPGVLNQLELILQSEYQGWDFFQMHGIENIIRLAGYNETKIKALVKSKFTQSSFRDAWYGRYEFKGVKKLIYELQFKDNNIIEPKVIQHIKKELINDYSAAV